MTCKATSTKPANCPLCQNGSVRIECTDARRTYFRCGVCELVFVAPNEFLTSEAEKAQYDCHRNSPTDPAYRNFLARLFRPVQSQILPGSRGLDFGCGPGPTLHLLFEEKGHQMEIYDPYYFPNQRVFEREYDFVTATEVVEHLHRPGRVLAQLWENVRPGGLLAMMTSFPPENIPFENWYYKNDETHVCFFSTVSFEYLAARLNAELQIEPNIAILKKRFAAPL